MDEDDHMDDDLDVTRTQQGDDIDLFDEGETSNGDGSHRAKGDNSEASCGPGEGGGGSLLQNVRVGLEGVSIETIEALEKKVKQNS